MPQRSILITGCSTGIGYCAAIELKKQGWRVFAAARKSKDVEKLAAEGLESVMCLGRWNSSARLYQSCANRVMAGLCKTAPF